jgi:hypothetical protein
MLTKELKKLVKINKNTESGFEWQIAL